MESQYTVKELKEYEDWLNSETAENKALVLARVKEMRKGLFGDSKSIGRGISEARIHEGPGPRIYYMIHGKTLVLLMYGGIKRTQDQDIKEAYKVLDRLIRRSKEIAAANALKTAKEK